MDTPMHLQSTTNNDLPKGLEQLFNWILHRYGVQSWRFSVDNSTTLSIRFTERSAIADSTSQQPPTPIMHDRSYRSKPPSSVRRDNMRQQTWLSSTGQPDRAYDTENSSGMFTNIAGGAYADHSNQDSGLALSGHRTEEHSHEDSGIGFVTFASNSNMGISEPQHVSTPLHTIPEITNNIDSCTSNIQTQTTAMTESNAVQTDMITVKQNTVFVQCPSVKKKMTQTTRISKDTINLQTDSIKRIDKGTTWDLQTSISTHTMTDYTNGIDKDISTDPPMGRHVQTDDTNHTLRRLGRQFKAAATQLEPCSHDSPGLNVIMQAKSSLANDIAKRALRIKMRYTSSTANDNIT